MGILERGAGIVADVARNGISAITGRIAQFTSGLVDTVIGGIRDWVANSVVGAAITRLISMFNPAGAVIQAIIAVYNTIQFFIERAQQLGALANSIFDSMAAIASGGIGNAVNAVEQALGRAVPVVLGFLARLVGLGDVATPVRNIMTRVRTVIDSAIDRAVAMIARMGQRVGGRRAGRSGSPEPQPRPGRSGTTGANRQPLQLPVVEFDADAEHHRLWIDFTGARPKLMVASQQSQVSSFLDGARDEIDHLPKGTIITLTDRPGNRRTKAECLGAVERARRAAGRLPNLQVSPAAAAQLPRSHDVPRQMSDLGHELQIVFEILHEVRLRLQISDDPSTSVRCVARITVSSGPAETAVPMTAGPNARPHGTIPNNYRTTERPSRPAWAMNLRSDHRAPGYVIGPRGNGFQPPAPNSAAQTPATPADIIVEHLTRATGDAQRRGIHDFDKHAEARLVAHIKSLIAADEGWKDRVKRLEININMSPCTACVGELRDLVDLVRGNRFQSATIHWTNIYPDSTRQSLNSLRGKYDVTANAFPNR